MAEMNINNGGMQVTLSDEIPTEPGLYLSAVSRTSGQIYITQVVQCQGQLFATRIGFDSMAYPLVPNDKQSRFNRWFRGVWWAKCK